MKKARKMLSVLAATALLFSSVFSVFASADTVPTQITFENGFSDGTTLQGGTVQDYLVEMNHHGLTLSVKSSDESVLKADLQSYGDDSDSYDLFLAACGTGNATITVTASDGTSASRHVTVSAAGDPNYTVTSDTTKDFSIAKGGSYIVKVHYTSDADSGTPVLQTNLTGAAQKDNALHIQMIDQDEDDYYFRVDAVGAVGASQALYLGSSGHVPQKLCTVAIVGNRDLRLDTTCDYTMNEGETYRFTAYTALTTPPQASVYNDRATVKCLGSVAGGYQYRLTAVSSGETMVTVTAGKESASFPVTVTTGAEPSVSSDTPENLSISQGASYTYKFTIIGGGEPVFKADPDGVVTVQQVKKDGTDYYCKVTAVGKPQAQTTLYATFPEEDGLYDTEVGSVTVTSSMKSDTNSDFSLQKGSGYTFRITGATSFYAGTPGVFSIQSLGKSGVSTLYRITAVGNPGQSAGLFMAKTGLPAQKVCAVTVKPIEMKSDTNSDFSLQKGAGYTIKITGATSFSAGSSGVVDIRLISRSGADSYYKITAIGVPGRSTGLYMAAAGSPQAKKICAVTVKPVEIRSDTNSNFSLAKGAGYQFAITAAGVNGVNFAPGTSGVFRVSLVRRSGNNFYYKLTAVGTPGQRSGIYVSVPGQAARLICVVTIK